MTEEERLEKERRLVKLLGADLVKRVSDMPKHFEVISSGVMAINLALGIGGFPRNHLSVIYGPEAGGKTTLCDAIAAETINNGGTPVLVDMEKKGSAAWRAQNIAAYGADPDRLLVLQPETGVEALNKIKLSIGVADVVLLDSVFHLVTPGELDASSSGDQHPAALARLVSTNMKSITSKLHNSGTALVWTNQLSYTFDQYNPERQPGGKRMEFTPIIIVRTHKVRQLKNGNEVYGIQCRANVKKNQASAPHKMADFVIRFDKGIDRVTDVWETARALGIIDRSGAWFSWQEDDPLGFKVQGSTPAVKLLEESPETVEAINKEIQKTTLELWSNPER